MHSPTIPLAPLQITFPFSKTGGVTSPLQIADTATSSSRQLTLSSSTSKALRLELPASPVGPGGPTSPRSPPLLLDLPWDLAIQAIPVGLARRQRLAVQRGARLSLAARWPAASSPAIASEGAGHD